MTYPKIELHVHLEGAMRAATLLEIARRNDHPLPATTPEEVAQLYRFRDFAHFIEIWLLTTAVIRTAADFRQIVVDYATEASQHGAVYLEGIFSPGDRAQRGADWDEMFEGCCDGIQAARELTGVEVRLTPDITCGDPLELAERTIDYAIRYRDRGIVAVGIGGPECRVPTQVYERMFRRAHDGGIGAVPHAGETTGPESIRAALDVLHADRIRHGIRSVDDPALVEELAARGTVLDVCLTSNVRTGVTPSLDAHPLPALVAAGVRCTLSTDDPAMFDTDLTREYAIATRLGLSPRSLFESGLTGALCDDATRARLRSVLDDFAWPTNGERNLSS